ncbi:asparaginase [Eubacterium ruminantium]|nr:asparaginase [Eubacterium ruminantium]
MTGRIKIITTGGTIASKDMGNGLAPGIEAEQLINKLLYAGRKSERNMQESASAANESIITAIEKGEIILDICSLMNIDSSDMRPEDWRIIADEIDRTVRETCETGSDSLRRKYLGIIVTHGTDTMAYTAGALSAMFEGLPIPVILTGSQLPAEAEGTDAAYNFCSALRAAGCGKTGVYIAFNGKLIDGRYSVKIDTDEMNAFSATDRRFMWSIDEPGEIGRETEHLEEHLDYRYEKLPDNPVRVILLHPALTSEEMALLMGDSERILLLLYGAGGLATGRDSLLPMIKKAADSGKKIYVLSQCLYRKTDLNRYEVGRKLREAGVISLGSYSTEYAVAYIMQA